MGLSIAATIGGYRMRSVLLAAMSAITLAACAPATPAPVAQVAEVATAPIAYGSNEAASATFTHDGVTFYYETYGQGEPLLLIHGNGSGIGGFAAQIEHFKTRYHVIAMDSRGQGKSGEGASPLTYEQMADDQAALLDHLKAGPVHVVGWSDGGIEALLLGIRHPGKVAKIVSMAANLNPTTEALYPETIAMIEGGIASVPAEARDTPDGRKLLKVMQLMLDHPNIEPKALAQITAPTLVMSGDQDMIRLDHTLEIFNALPNGALAVLPGSTHAVPLANPKLFNEIVEEFLATPFKKKDRVADAMAEFEAAAAQ